MAFSCPRIKKTNERNVPSPRNGTATTGQSRPHQRPPLNHSSDHPLTASPGPAMHRHFSLLLPVGVLLLPLASTSPISAVEPASYGHWDLTYAGGNAASGYRWENVNANYSSSLETSAAVVVAVVQCKQLYDPTVRTTTRSCDDASFGYEVTAEGGQSCKWQLFSSHVWWLGRVCIYPRLRFFRWGESNDGLCCMAR